MTLDTRVPPGSQPGGTSRKAQRLVTSARNAGQVRGYQTDPDVVALHVERVRRYTSLLSWTAIVLRLAFTMVNVQQFAAGDAPAWSPWWITAWLLDPMVSMVLISVLLAEQVTAKYQISIGFWPRVAKWAALAATYTMNTWGAWASGSVKNVLLHSVPPLLVFVATEALPTLRDRLTEAVFAAERYTRDRSAGAADPAADPVGDPASAKGDPEAVSVRVTTGDHTAVDGHVGGQPPADPSGRQRVTTPSRGGHIEAGGQDGDQADHAVSHGGQPEADHSGRAAVSGNGQYDADRTTGRGGDRRSRALPDPTKHMGSAWEVYDRLTAAGQRVNRDSIGDAIGVSNTNMRRAIWSRIKAGDRIVAPEAAELAQLPDREPVTHANGSPDAP